MNVSNDVQGMQQLFSSQEITQAGAGAQARPAAAADSGATDEATLSSAASIAAQAASGSDVRMDKVTQVQQALAAGTYSVPSSEVAGRMIDQMLGK
jgi:negative regulator of flagellin synthesis FlgM